MPFTHGLATNNYGPAHLIVATSPANGSHVTLASAMADAVSGDTIFMRDSVTENVTITPGVNIASWDSSAANVPSITGTLTMTGAGTSAITGLRLVTNSAASIAITGSAASILMVSGCYFDCTNNTGITFSSSNAGARLSLDYCRGNLGTTGIALYSHSSAGILSINWSGISNTGNSTTASDVSSGSALCSNSSFLIPFSTSSTGNFGITFSDIATSATNTVCLTTAGTGTSNFIQNCRLISGSASSVSIGSGTTCTISNSAVNSSNTNPVTGAGTLNYSPINFIGTGKSVNVTTRNPLNYGTWTPTITGASTAGTTTYTTQQGYYTIVGNIVYIEGTIVITAATGTGNAVIGSFPFTIKNLTNYNAIGNCNIASATWTWPALNTMTSLRGNVNTTNALIGTQGSGAAGNIQMNNSAATFVFAMWYQI
jgi:hypothetical protein